MKQCEDEIASMNMAVGAGQMGVRAMTATSGGGFALMTEAVGLAGMLETPVVIVNVQRGGPSTGLPTKTEQGDLFQILGAGQGEYPRVILAPQTIEDAFHTTAESFNLAERYQCPVLILSDLMLSEHTETVDKLDLNVRIDRGDIVTEWNEATPYLRYKITPSGISPRAYPGTKNAAYVSPSDEHNERGEVISDVFTDPVDAQEDDGKAHAENGLGEKGSREALPGEARRSGGRGCHARRLGVDLQSSPGALAAADGRGHQGQHPHDQGHRAFLKRRSLRRFCRRPSARS